MINVRSRLVPVMMLFAASLWLAEAASAGQDARANELISLHHLDTAVSIGSYYLKQETLASIRGYLKRIGREENLGAAWNAGNPWWRQAEEKLLEEMMGGVDAGFSSLAWLRPEWNALYSDLFSSDEISALIAHFRTDVGAKQAQIIDHTISTQIMMTLSFSDKLKAIPGLEDELARMQALWNDEDERMRFSIQDATNATGQAFALSSLGKKYFTTLILSLTGIVNQRLYEMATQSGLHVERLGEKVRPFVEGFRNGNV